MIKGYHVLGHCILEGWQALAKAGAEAAAMPAIASIKPRRMEIPLRTRMVSFLP